MSQIKLVSFDADDTLWDFTSMMRRGTQAVVDTILEYFGEDYAYIDQDYLREAQLSVIMSQDPDSINYTECRRQAFREVMHNANLPNPDLLGDELLDIYLHARDHKYELFDGVHETLTTLAERFPLAWITNGTTHPAKVGLQDYFSAVILPDTIGIRKPHAEVFHHAADILGHKTRHMLHIGDNIHTDVGGIMQAGGKGIWFNPQKRYNRTNFAPLAEIDTIPSVLEFVD